MIALIQKVTSASVAVNNKVISQINQGLLVFVGISINDTKKDSDILTEKILNLRLFESEKRFFNSSVKEMNFELLLVSQFTLCADCSKGRRPSFHKAMPPKKAKFFYNDFVETFKKHHKKTFTGVFGANMQIALVNDGPITILLES